jgi:hypothetical protein
MGLDQSVTIKGEKDPIGTWRRHPDLHGWMRELWWFRRMKDLVDSVGHDEALEVMRRESDRHLDYFVGRATAEEAGIFNQVDLPLTEEDILACMEAIRSNKLLRTSGFFFGRSPRTKKRRAEDLAIMERCLEAIRAGKEVVYSSWW